MAAAARAGDPPGCSSISLRWIAGSCRRAAGRPRRSPQEAQKQVQEMPGLRCILQFEPRLLRQQLPQQSLLSRATVAAATGTAIAPMAGVASTMAVSTSAFLTITTTAAAVTATTVRTTAATATTAAGPVLRAGTAAASTCAAVTTSIVVAMVAAARTAGRATTTAPATPTITTRTRPVRQNPSPPPRLLWLTSRSTTRSQSSNHRSRRSLPTRRSPRTSAWSVVYGDLRSTGSFWRRKDLG